MANEPDRALAAFRRLLAEGHGGGQAKVDALVALAQRTVFAPTWSAGDQGLRTLVNSSGDAALPIFSAYDQLDAAATHFGWKQPDGSVPHTEIGARQALRHAVAHEIPFVVVDISAEHALEVDRTELEPLLGKGSGASASGPFAAVGRVRSSMMEAVKATPPPETMEAIEEPAGQAPAAPPPPPPPEAAPPVAAPPPSPAAAAVPPSAALTTDPEDPGAGVVSTGDLGAATPAGAGATFGSGTSVTVSALAEAPADELLNALSAVLRGYPEVEWAAALSLARGPAAPQPTIGLRLDTSFRQRVGEIIGAIRACATENGAALDVLLLDDAEVMRAARDTLVFYPWKR